MKRLLVISLLAFGVAFAYGGRQMMQQRNAPAGQRIQASEIFAHTQHEAVAALLGLTPEALEAEHQSGKTLAEIGEELGWDTADLSVALTNLRTEAIANAVSSGELTEAQATMLESRTDAVVAAMLERECAEGVGLAFGRNGTGGCFAAQANRVGEGANMRAFAPRHLGPRWDR